MSKHEDTFLEAWNTHPIASRLPKPERQHQFHPVRHWQFDFSWSLVKLAVEIYGSFGFGRGSHRSGNKLHEDLDKCNEAQRLGWRVLQFSEYHLRKCRIEDTIEMVAEILTSASEATCGQKRRKKKIAIDSE